jgi:predicted TIM-barrel fold metal-dependent hydrolase
MIDRRRQVDGTPKEGELAMLDPEWFLPEPDVEEIFATIISVDDHVVEPPHTFEGRIPRSLEEAAPRIVETPDGNEVWVFEGGRFTQAGTNAFAGRRRDNISLEPCRFDQMRPGCYQVDARVADMDVSGIWASVNFPSSVTGFCGRVLFNAHDVELGKACIRAWNDWLFEEWYLAHPQRIIPLGIAYLRDPIEAVREIERNAARGFRAISLPQRPQDISLPSLWTREHWDPIIRACVETETVISLHVGSSGLAPQPHGAGLGLMATLFEQLALSACAEWLWSEIPLRFPKVKIAMSEGGIGWVAMMLDRLDNIVDRSGYGLGWDERPADVLQRNFWFCTIDDPSTIDTRHRIGVDKIMVETDYPHGDSTWPHCQAVLREAWGHIPTAELRAMCSENAASLYRHEAPSLVVP